MHHTTCRDPGKGGTLNKKQDSTTTPAPHCRRLGIGPVLTFPGRGSGKSTVVCCWTSASDRPQTCCTRSGYDAAWRELACLDRTTPFEVRQRAGHSLKSAVKHILTADKRDSTIFPTEGALIRLNQELAGLGGSIGFLKHEAELQYNLPLSLDITLQGSFFCGHMEAMYPEKTYNISDRFFLGGPLNVRGFKMRGIGP